MRGRAEQKRSLTFYVHGQTMYMDKQGGASVLHPRLSPNHNLNKASQRMAHPSIHLALPLKKNKILQDIRTL